MYVTTGYSGARDREDASAGDGGDRGVVRVAHWRGYGRTPYGGYTLGARGARPIAGRPLLLFRLCAYTRIQTYLIRVYRYEILGETGFGSHSCLRPPRCVSTGPVVVRLAATAFERARERFTGKVFISTPEVHTPTTFG